MAGKNILKKLPYFTDTNGTLYTLESVEIDEQGEGWLTPEQVKRLEGLNNLARLSSSASSRLRKSKRILAHCESLTPMQAIHYTLDTNVVAASTSHLISTGA